LKAAVPEVMKKCIVKVRRTPSEWRIKNMRTRWGTCNVVDKRIWLNLQLAKKPPECLEYVITHELVHLYERNHSRKFWGYMDRFYPDWREARKKLNAAEAVGSICEEGQSI
ncbi:MAG: M48 family metallopeptidase, partial [Lachnospiraceae bacterium]|nr:M48 family metallopeptidase [Lachnospiraceae bacterium]